MPSNVTGVVAAGIYPVLALRMDGANGSATFVDEIGNPVTLVNAGRISIGPGAFGGQDGVAQFEPGGYLTIPMTAPLRVGLGDFTKSAWVKAILAQPQPQVIEWANPPAGAPFYIDALGGSVNFGTGINASYSFIEGNWYHLEVCQTGGMQYGFVNGVLITSGAITPEDESTCTEIVVGGWSGGFESVTGGIEEVLIYDYALHTANFTPPTAPWQAPLAAYVAPALPNPSFAHSINAITSTNFGTPYGKATYIAAGIHSTAFGTELETNHVTGVQGLPVPVFVCHCDGTNGSTTFTDEFGNTITPTAATISTAQSVFGGASASIGASGLLTVALTPALRVQSRDYTMDIRFWAADFARKILFHVLGGVGVYVDGPSLTVTGVGSALHGIGAGAWNHARIARHGTTLKVFMNGVSILSGTSAPYDDSAETTLYIGGFDGQPDGMTFVDEVIIYNGVALSTTNFTPPIAAWTPNLSYSSPALPTPHGAYFQSGVIPAGIHSAFVSTPLVASFGFTAAYQSGLASGFRSMTFGAAPLSVKYFNATSVATQSRFGAPSSKQGFSGSPVSINATAFGTVGSLLRLRGMPTSINATAFGAPGAIVSSTHATTAITSTHYGLAVCKARYVSATTAINSTNLGVPIKKQALRGSASSIYATFFGTPASLNGKVCSASSIPRQVLLGTPSHRRLRAVVGISPTAIFGLPLYKSTYFSRAHGLNSTTFGRPLH